MKIRAFLSVLLALSVLLSLCGCTTTRRVLSSDIVVIEDSDEYLPDETPSSSPEKVSEEKEKEAAVQKTCKNGGGHHFSEKVIAPTCTAKGYTLHTCEYCGVSYKSNTTPAGHDWGEWKVTRKPTAEAEGTKVRTCKRCGKKNQTTVPATGSINYATMDKLVASIPETYASYTDASTASQIDYLAKQYRNNRSLYTNEELEELEKKLRTLCASPKVKYTDCHQIFINTADAVSKNTYVDATITVYKAGGSLLDMVGDKKGKVKIRGNSTSNAPKYPVNIKFNIQRPMLSLGTAKQWSLLSNPYDPTLLRCGLASELAKEMGMDTAPDCTWAEVWFNGNYFGLYTVIESVEDHPERVPISIDRGDYLFEVEAYREEKGRYYFKTDLGLRFAFKKPSEPTDAQLKDAAERMSEVHSAVHSLSTAAIKRAIDVDSFVSYYLVNELFAPLDFGNTSEYFHFRDGVLFAGPVWDYDLAAGNLGSTFPQYTSTESASYSYWCAKNIYFYKDLMENYTFRKQAVDTLTEAYPLIRGLYASNGAVKSKIRQFTTDYKAAIERNFKKWDITYCWDGMQRTPDPVFEDNIKFLEKWLENRHKWMIENIVI